MASTSFVNIDLEESQIKDEENQDKVSPTTTSDQPEPNSAESKLTERKAELDRIGKQLVEDYSKYYRINTTSQVSQVSRV